MRDSVFIHNSSFSLKRNQYEVRKNTFLIIRPVAGAEDVLHYSSEGGKLSNAQLRTTGSDPYTPTEVLEILHELCLLYNVQNKEITPLVKLAVVQDVKLNAGKNERLRFPSIKEALEPLEYRVASKAEQEEILDQRELFLKARLYKATTSHQFLFISKRAEFEFTRLPKMEFRLRDLTRSGYRRFYQGSKFSALVHKLKLLNENSIFYDKEDDLQKCYEILTGEKSSLETVRVAELPEETLTAFLPSPFTVIEYPLRVS